MLESKFNQMPGIQEENRFRSIISLILIMQEIDQLGGLKRVFFYIVIQHQ